MLSIVTPSFNQAAYLEQTIQSVLGQESVDLEYIIVDGASTDGSQEIIQRYAGRLAWWVSEADAGQADAINKGLRRARGEYVAWLNSDDLYLPGAASRALAALQAHPQAGFVFGDAITIDPHGHRLKTLAFEDWGLNDLMEFRIICQPAVFMRRSILERAGYLDLNYHFMLDHHLWLRMARLAPIQHIAQVLAAARHHPGAKNMSQAPGFGREALQVLEWLKTDPQFAPLAASNRRRIQAGAYRLNARYLLDGDQPGPALKSYLKALVRNPAFTLQHAHRMLFALASLVGGRLVRRLYERSRGDIYRPNSIEETSEKNIENIHT